MNKRLLIIGDFSPERETHVLTDAAISHALNVLGRSLEIEWVATNAVRSEKLNTADGIWIGTGSPYRNLDGALKAIQHARVNKIPCIGTCSGFQHIVIEYAAHVLQMKDVGHAEYDSGKETMIITGLSCSLRGKTMHVNLDASSRAYALYASSKIEERYYCSYGINPKYEAEIFSGFWKVTGRDSDNETRVIELENHPFMLATLFVPQASSTAEVPHPLIIGFLNAVLNVSRKS